MQLLVAKIGPAHGLRGEVRLDIRTDSPAERLAPGMELQTDPPEVGPLTVSRLRIASGRTVATFAGVTDRNQAEELRGVALVIESADVPAEDDAYYPHELQGLVAQLADGTKMGTVADLDTGAAQDLLIVNTGAAKVAVPFVAALVPEVDLENGLVIIDPPGGLFPEPLPATGPAAESTAAKNSAARATKDQQ